MEYTETDVHKAISQQSEWLNTSRPLKPSDLKGRIILLDFWTFCCINCIHVMPDLKKLEAEFGDNLTVIGVHSAKFANERGAENIKAAVLRHGIEHAVVNDYNLRIWRSFGVSSWPTFILINPEGKIESVYAGERQLEHLRRDISRLVEKYGSTMNKSKLPYSLERDRLPETTLRFPGKITYVASFKGGPILFVSDSGNHRIVGMRPTGEVVLSVGQRGVAGHVDGSFEEARFDTPQGILYREGVLYVVETESHLLREVDLEARKVRTLAGTGKQGGVGAFERAPALTTALSSPWDLCFYPTPDDIAIAMAGTHQIWVYHISSKTIDILAGNGRESIDDGAYPDNSLSQPSGLSPHDGKLYFADSETSSLRVLENGQVRTLIGRGLFYSGFKDGKRDTALMQHCLGVYADASGVYIADAYNHSIRHYDPKTQELGAIVGDGKPGVLNEPNGLVKVGNTLFITDTNNHRIVRLNLRTKEIMPISLHD